MCKQYEIKEEDFKRVSEFVNKRKKDNELYHKRGGFKEIDLLTGAMGEVASYYFLKERGIDANYPDFEIYDRKSKSYDADLRTDSKFFHVKAQNLDSYKRYGDSYLLQRRDKIVQKKIQNHYLIFCRVDIENRKVEILGSPSVSSIHNNDLWDECKYYLFRKTKVALYLKDIKEKLTRGQLWRI